VNVTAVVLNWRRADDTIACVRALDVDRVIVVDNASGDDSIDKIVAACPGAELVANERNDGYAGGNNVGIARALDGRPDAVLILNNDVVVQPDAIPILAQHLRGTTGIVAPLSLLDGTDGVIDFYTARVDLRHMALVARGRDEPEPSPPLTEPVVTDYATGSAILIEAELLRRLGGFDDRFFLVWEDVDLSLRARVRHGRSRSFGSDGSPLYKYFFARNSFLIVDKHVRWPWRGRTRALIERRYESWSRQPGDEAAARAIGLGLEHGRAGLFGPPPAEVVSALSGPALS
jgi:glycosyltransferase involved in cell wall biosynthesis